MRSMSSSSLYCSRGLLNTLAFICFHGNHDVRMSIVSNLRLSELAHAPCPSSTKSLAYCPTGAPQSVTQRVGDNHATPI
jgi:hypothetical protein